MTFKDTEVTKSSTLRVLMFPWLAYGHISPYLNVAKKLADRGFLIHLCSTPINLKPIKKKITEKYTDSIQLVELHLPELPELPPHYHTTNGLPPHLNSTLSKALKLSKPNFAKILENLKPDLVIYDILQQWAEGVANAHNIPAARLLTSGAAVLSYCSHLFNKSDADFPFKAIYLTKMERARFIEMMEKVAKEKDPQEEEEEPFEQGTMKLVLMSTSRVIEAKYIDYLTELLKWKIVPSGPPVQDPTTNAENDGDMELFDWLGTKDEHSTVFISFGSEYFLNKQDREEIAFALELSKVNFIWVVRFPKGEELKLEEALPEGFLERIGDRGRIIEGWAPQPRILNHPSIGGFVSHCGWNSVMESVDFGVPIIAMPMHLDQPMNARLMVELGVAREVIRDDDGKVHRHEIAQVLKGVIVGETGETMRTKVRDISKNLKSIRGEEMDATAEALIQLSKNSK